MLPTFRKPEILRLRPAASAQDDNGEGTRPLDAASLAMTKPLKIRRVGNSLGVILPKGVLDSLHLQEGSTVTITRTPDGLLLMPLDSDHEETMAAYEVVARTYKNALRELAK